MQRINLPALEAALAKLEQYEKERDYNTAHAQRIEIIDALPHLIAELRELRARTTPVVIGEEHRDGRYWMLWDSSYEKWFKCKWSELGECWHLDGERFFYGTPTHALPMPEAPDA